MILSIIGSILLFLLGYFLAFGLIITIMGVVAIWRNYRLNRKSREK